MSKRQRELSQFAVVKEDITEELTNIIDELLMIKRKLKQSPRTDIIIDSQEQLNFIRHRILDVESEGLTELSDLQPDVSDIPF